MNMWFLITIVFFFCVFIVCCLVEIASTFKRDEEYMDKHRTNKNKR